MDYWDVIAPYWDQVRISDEAEFLRDFPRVPEAVRHLLATHWLVSEVCNGGFHQFFSNCTGVLAPEAAEGFDAIGLGELQAIAREAMEFFGTPYPRNAQNRQRALEEFAGRHLPGSRREDWDPFFQLDDRFYASLELAGAKDAFGLAANEFAAAVSRQS